MNTYDHPEEPEITSGTNTSYWTDTTPPEAMNSLKENIETDVVIIGEDSDKQNF